MGTRADFYVGKGGDAEWLGSVGYDGYPDGVPADVVKAKSEADYRKRVAKLLSEDASGTVPEQGWPWPWDDSNTTDYAYAFIRGKVMASRFGGPWFNAPRGEPANQKDGKQEFPNMKNRKNVARGDRSGLMILVAK